MSDERDLIRSRISIVELVSEKVSLKRQGKDFKGLCPFHDDKNPSFQVSDKTGTYRCWSCGAHGDLFTWVMETQKVDFREALRILAGQAGVTLREANDKQRSQRADQEAAMSAAHQFFRDSLEKCSEAKEYCEKRGLDERTLTKWEIGYAPKEGVALTVTLQKQGIQLALSEQLFLLRGNQKVGFEDRFTGRLIFPIRDERGALVAFGGRIIGDGQPKYINSSDTPLYSKRRVLYGMHQAKESITKTGRAVLVEGYLDVIACHRAGVTEAVASLGTAMSEEQAKLLKRWCNQVLILYDSDEAGQKAAERASQILQTEGLHVRIALMPQNEDPDTLLRRAGVDAVQKACSGGLTPLDYRIFQARARHDVTDEVFWNEVVHALAQESNELELQKHLIELSAQYPDLRDPLAAQRAIRKQIHQERLRLRKTATDERPRTNRPATQRAQIKGAERAVFEALQQETLREQAWQAIRETELFVTGSAIEMATALISTFGETPPEGEMSIWLPRVEPESARAMLSDLMMNVDPRTRVESLELQYVVTRLRKQREAARLKMMRNQLLDDDATLKQVSEKLRRIKGADELL